MTHEWRRATWSGLDGRAVVRRDRPPRVAAPRAPADEEVNGAQAADEAEASPRTDPPEE
jgi:hypothetical protein